MWMPSELEISAHAQSSIISSHYLYIVVVRIAFFGSVRGHASRKLWSDCITLPYQNWKPRPEISSTNISRRTTWIPYTVKIGIQSSLILQGFRPCDWKLPIKQFLDIPRWSMSFNRNPFWWVLSALTHQFSIIVYQAKLLPHCHQ